MIAPYITYSHAFNSLWGKLYIDANVLPNWTKRPYRRDWLISACVYHIQRQESKSGVQCHHIYKGVTACRWRDSRKDRNNGRVHFATGCASLVKPDRARKSKRGSGLKPISGFVPAAKILQLESDWRIGNPLFPVV